MVYRGSGVWLMFNPDGCFCCEPPEDPCTLSGCTWSSTDMSDTDLTAGETYHNSVSGSTPDGTYEVTSTQDATTGNDPACRKITIETVVAPTRAETVYAICWKDNATHTPSAQCPLTNVSFCVESKRHGDSDSGLTDGVVFVVRQDGKIYATATQSVGVNWKRASGTYTASQFTWVNGSTHPDFTADGTQIEFGFALKLSVSTGGEPYDVVLFDNLCITLTKNCTGACNTSVCDVLNTGTTLTIDQQDVGVTYAIDTGVGLLAPSHKTVFPVSASSKVLQLVLSSDILTSAGCPVPSIITICANVLSECLTPSGNGYSVQFILRQGATTVTLGTGSVAGDTGGNWAIVNVSYTWPTTSTLDIASPIELLLKVSSGARTALGTIWVDNVCVRVTYGSCPKWDYAATVSGVTLTPKAGFGCNATWVSQAETNLNSTLILRRVTIASGCIFSYSGSVGTTPGRVDYSVSFALSGWNGTQFTTGALTVVAGSGGNNMPANYTLAAPFDPCTETGTFNFASTNGAAACLTLSASGSITVVKI